MADLRRSLAALCQPAETEFRAEVGTLLAQLLVDPGRLVNPLYAGPVQQADLLRAEIESVARAAGVKMLSADDLRTRDAAVRGIALVTDREASRMAEFESARREGVQVVIWARHGAEMLEGPLRAWVQEGVALSPSADVHPRDVRRLRAAMQQIAGPEQAGPRCLVWVGPPEALEALAAEARVRLGLEGAGPALDLTWSGEDDGLGADARSAVVRLAGGAGPEGAALGWAQVRGVLSRGLPAVLVTDPAGEAALRLLGDRGPRPGEALWVWDPGGMAGGETAQWPHLDAALLGHPQVGDGREGTSIIPLRERSFAEVLQEVAGWEKPGTVMVYESGRLGWIRVLAGEIRSARRVHDRNEAGTAAETIARIRDMAQWYDARVAWIPRGPTAGAGPAEFGGCRIPLSSAAFDLMTAGRGSSGFASREQSPGEVARGLLAWGLVEEAVLVLGEAARRGATGATDCFLLGHFRAPTEPKAAAESFRQAVRLICDEEGEGADLDRALDAALNALVVELRAGARAASSAWRLVENAELTSAEALFDDAGRVGAVLEVAVRAGRREEAARLAGWLLERAGADETARRYLPVLRALGLTLPPGEPSSPAPASPSPPFTEMAQGMRPGARPGASAEAVSTRGGAGWRA